MMQVWTGYLTEGDWKAITDRLEGAVERVLERHGFKQPHSATSVTHNIMAENTERDRHAARMLALSGLISEAKRVSEGTLNPGNVKNRLDLAIAAVEREFKP